MYVVWTDRGLDVVQAERAVWLVGQRIVVDAAQRCGSAGLEQKGVREGAEDHLVGAVGEARDGRLVGRARHGPQLHVLGGVALAAPLLQHLPEYRELRYADASRVQGEVQDHHPPPGLGEGPGIGVDIDPGYIKKYGVVKDV